MCHNQPCYHSVLLFAAAMKMVNHRAYADVYEELCSHMLSLIYITVGVVERAWSAHVSKTGNWLDFMLSSLLKRILSM